MAHEGALLTVQVIGVTTKCRGKYVIPHWLPNYKQPIMFVGTTNRTGSRSPETQTSGLFSGRWELGGLY